MSKAITCLFYASSAVLTRKIYDVNVTNTKEYVFPSRRGYKLSLHYNNTNKTGMLVKYHENIPVDLTKVDMDRYSKLQLSDVIKH